MQNGPVLPPSMTVARFADTVRAMRAVVGADHVKDDAQTIFSYRDPYAANEDDAFLPSMVIAPASVEEVQGVLKVANERGLYLWPISTGKNYAYGGPAPRVKGTAVLDLRRMNRIIEVNEKLGYALVEPGVSYYDLYRHLKKTGSKHWIDCAAPGWGGVVGNALDRGAGYTPYGDHFGAQCGMEVVLANGDVLRTGMGGIPDSRAWQTFKYGFGPYLDGMFTQSNYGVVTKMGIWLMEEPPAHLPIMITFPREDSLGDIVDVLRPLRKNLVFNGTLILAGLVWESSTKEPRARWYGGKGAMPESAMKKMAADLDLGMWNLTAGLYGTPDLIKTTYALIRDVFSKIPGAKFYSGDDRPDDPSWAYRKKLMIGEPNMSEFNMLNWVPGGGHLGFSPCIPFDGVDAQKVYALCSDVCRSAGLDWVGSFGFLQRAALQVLCLQFDRTDREERERANRTFSKLVADAAAAGYGEYRTHLAFMDQVMGTHSYGDHSFRKLTEAIKDAVDPKGILQPGKSGIWPKHLRGKNHAI
jgi:4-cresol dehydrogenase (hydroxylating)